MTINLSYGAAELIHKLLEQHHDYIETTSPASDEIYLTDSMLSFFGSLLDHWEPDENPRRL